MRRLRFRKNLGVVEDKFSLFVTINDFHTCINFPDYILGLFQEWHMGAGGSPVVPERRAVKGVEALVERPVRKDPP